MASIARQLTPPQRTPNAALSRFLPAPQGTFRVRRSHGVTPRDLSGRDTINCRSNRIVAASSALLLAAGLGAGGSGAIYAAASPGATTTVVREVQPGGTNAAATSTTTVNAVYDATQEGVVEITVTT